MPGIDPEIFLQIGPRQWWLYFELSEPRSVSDLSNRSGLVETSVRSHLSALAKRGVILKFTRATPGEVVYVRAVSLSDEQEDAARKRIASKRLSSPARGSGAAMPASSTVKPSVPRDEDPNARSQDLGKRMTGPNTNEPADKSEKLFAVMAFIVPIITIVVAGFVASTANSGFSGFLLFLIVFLVVGLILVAAAAGLSELAKPAELRQQKAAARQHAQVRSLQTSGRVPLRQWRGLAYMTKANHVEAFCARCRRTWPLEGKRANTLADAQGLANRLIRGGTKMEQFGATFAVGASGRRIASGNESERQQRDLAWALSLAACPTCHRVDEVQLKKP